MTGAPHSVSSPQDPKLAQRSIADGAIATANATFCATLVAQWVAQGLTAAFIAPGSRSTPLALALAVRSDLRIERFHDERSASFAALGHGLICAEPAVLVCTSGTAAAHFHGAVIEASLSAVPLLVCTADRPPELWDRGAPQTIDQTHIFGSAVRDFFEPGPPDDGDPVSWPALARRAWAAATGPTPGPVHLNLSFREPLAGAVSELPTLLPPEETGRREPVAAPELIAEIMGRIRSKRGVLIAGRGQSDPLDLLSIAERLGWPIISDHRSGCRAAAHANVITRFDSLLRHRRFAELRRPEVVLRFGEIVSSKAVSSWLRGLDADVLSARPQGRHIDPESIASLLFDEAGVAGALASALAKADEMSEPEPEWLAIWRAADDRADAAVKAHLSIASDSTEPVALSEIAIAQRVLSSVSPECCLVVASSMPVRDIEWFGGPSRCTVVSNRGANGIDGTVATAIGIASTGMPTTVLVGDVAFLHDSTSLVALASRNLDLTIVVTDNDGGGIFSFLAQHDLLDPDRFEQLFGTPHGADLIALANAHNLAAEPLTAEVDLEPCGVRVFVAKTDRSANLADHEAAHAAVAAAIGSL